MVPDCPRTAESDTERGRNMEKDGGPERHVQRLPFSSGRCFLVHISTKGHKTVQDYTVRIKYRTFWNTKPIKWAPLTCVPSVGSQGPKTPGGRLPDCLTTTAAQVGTQSPQSHGRLYGDNVPVSTWDRIDKVTGHSASYWVLWARGRPTTSTVLCKYT